MTLTEALSAAQTANTLYLNLCQQWAQLVSRGSPQPQTNNAQAAASTAQTAVCNALGDVTNAAATLDC